MNQGKQRSWRAYARHVRGAVDDLRRGKLKGHMLEIGIVFLLFITLMGYFVLQPQTTAKRKISSYFKDIQQEAKYHRQQLLKIQEERNGLDKLESFHSSAYAKLISEFEEALSKDVSLGAAQHVLLQEICRDPLHGLQGQYFASEGQNFDNNGPLNETWPGVVAAAVGQVVKQTKEGRAGMTSCSLFDVGSSSRPDILVEILNTVSSSECETYIYETTSSSVERLEQALEASPHTRRVGLKGFWNYTMDGKSAPFKVTTMDTLMAEQLQKHEYLESDLIVARIGRMVDDSFWKEIHGGADTIERIAGRRINLSPLQGLEKFLLLKRLTMVVWESYTDHKLKEEIDYVSSFGYKVYIVGRKKFVRVDGYYYDQKYSGLSQSNSAFGIEESYLGTCHFSVTLVAFVETHSINSFIQQEQLPCKHFKGVSCKCDNFRTDRVYDMC
ncbi:hypothetical protein HOP50_20g86700 [Chloropicon primus]|uniref:Uncharacterized protein n=1 Tax=Chloropicon primus TaxID=1764295 RepID=A0A5B8N003_9CHLO|nr:hypothetical protein A3770_20p86210 [Chloropicon primus]UPR05320.1 hypothetical protein HOP50_20g86700 [Chloropicon primus]|eukprot:QDZ26103.1 hypothetical protein A3770_20p86210 [Chloropicon primus]